MEIHGFLISVSTPTANGHIIFALLQAIHLSSKIATVHFSAHTKEIDTISSGNDRTDRAVAYASENNPPYPLSTLFLILPLPLTNIINHQANVPQSGKGKWIQKGAKQLSDGLYVGSNRLPVF